MIEIVSNIIFGVADNGIMLVCAIIGMSTSKSTKGKATTALFFALVGNAISDGVAGLIAGNISLALGSFAGCLIIAGIWVAISKLSIFTKNNNQRKEHSE